MKNSQKSYEHIKSQTFQQSYKHYVHLKNFKNDKLSKYISIEGKEYLDQIKKFSKKE